VTKRNGGDTSTREPHEATKTQPFSSLSPGVAGGSNLAAARSGDRRAALEALRDTLASLLDTSEAQVHAQLAAQYRATLADLAALTPSASKGGVDELKSRRASKDRGTATNASRNA
jgi:hypothetical protein